MFGSSRYKIAKRQKIGKSKSYIKNRVNSKKNNSKRIQFN